MGTPDQDKFQPPGRCAHRFSRPRLERELAAALARRVVCVSAPAGSGKTTMLEALLEAGAAAGLGTAWLSLDAGDDVPGGLLRAAQTALAEPDAPGKLAGRLRRRGAATLLVLDDFDALRDPAAAEVAVRLVAECAPALKLALTTRAPLPPAFEALRAAGELAEFGASELNLQRDEVGPFVRHLSGCELAPAEIDLLFGSTGGWVAGVQLAAALVQRLAGSSAAPRPTPSAADDKTRILLVDDQPDNLRLLIKLLPKHEYTVHPANSGEAALRFVRSTLPDLILLDIMMPNMDGFEVCARLKADPRTRDIPVIFLSADDQLVDKARAFAAGGVDYLTKPFQAEEVIMHIETHLALSRQQKDLARRVESRSAEVARLQQRLEQEVAQRKAAQQRLTALESVISMKLIESKLAPPPPLQHALPLARLEARFGDACSHRLVTLSAPAGYGKTVTLARLRAYAEAHGIPSGWVSLDSEHNDPAQFMQYVFAALGRAHPSIGRDASGQARHGGGFSMKAALNSLCGELGAVDRVLALFLDDYHTIENAAVHEAMDWLLAYCPSSLKFFIAGRSVLPLKTARLRARGEAYEFTMADLALRRDEVGPFVAAVGRHALDQQQARLLHESTEGWPAGIQLAALALKSGEDVAQFVRNFSGRSGDLTAYVGEIVLAQLRPALSGFLGFSALFERFSVDLCRDLEYGEEAARMLDEVRAGNLFLIALDGAGEWFRYHHLFADYLRSRFLVDHPQRVGAIYRAASRWFERRDLIREAIGYALAGNDYDRAADLVAASAYDLARRHGEHATVLNWVSMLPPEYVEQRPHIKLIRIFSLLFTHRFAEADELLRGMEQERGEAGDGDEVLRAVREMRCIYHGLKGDATLAASHCAEWLARWGAQQSEEAALVEAAFGYSACLAQDYEFAARRFAEARRAFERVRAHYGLAWIDAMQSLCAFEQGEAIEAQRILTQALAALADKLGAQSYGTSMLSLLLARVCYERNQIERAEEILGEFMSLAKGNGLAESIFAGYTTQARLLRMRGDFGQAEACLEEAISHAEGAGLRRLAVVLEADRIALCLKEGRTDAALRAERMLRARLEERRAAPELELAGEIALRILDIKLKLAAAQESEALALTKKMLADMRRHRRQRVVVTLLCLSAILHSRRGSREEALRALDEALALGAPRGLCRVFVEEGPQVGKLLAEILERRQAAGAPDEAGLAYLRQVIAAFGGQRPPEPAPAAEPAQAPGREGFSARELQILRLMANGLGNRDLAEQLFLSEATVKWHLSRIYAKLNVANRTGAILRANELALLNWR